MWVPKAPSGVPTGVAVFPTDVAIRRFAERARTIVHFALEAGPPPPMA